MSLSTETWNPQPSWQPGLLADDALRRNFAAEPALEPVQPASFADQVRGTGAREIDLELAQIAQDVSRADSSGTGAWRRLDATQLAERGIDATALENPDTGFRAGIYTDGNGRYVLAFSGSNDVQDWLTNLRQGVGIDTEQYDQAQELASRAKMAFGDELVITGHSLGGGQAGLAALATDTPAVTFNAAGVHDSSLERAGLDAGAAFEAAQNGAVRRYAIDGEILTELQERDLALRWVMPDAPGSKLQLDDPDPQSFWERLVPFNETAHAVQLHGMDAVLQALQADQPWR